MSILKNKKSLDIQGVLQVGKTSEFWQVICEAIEQSREHLQTYQDSEEFKDLPADKYKLESELIRAKRQFLNTLKETPDNIISWLSTPDNKIENFDPYFKNTPTDG